MADALTDAKTSRDSIGILTNNIVCKKANGAMDTVQIVFECKEDRIQMGVAQSMVADFYKPRHVEYDFLSSISMGCTYGLDVLGGYISDLKYVASKEGAKSLGGFGAIGSMFPTYWDWMVFWKMTAFLRLSHASNQALSSCRFLRILVWVSCSSLWWLRILMISSAGLE